MKVRSATLQGGLAAVALVAAFFAWQRDPDAPGRDDLVVALDIGKSELTAVRLQTPDLNVEVSRRNDEVWIHAAPIPKPPPAVVATDAGVSVQRPSAPVPPPRDIRGSEVASKLMEKFAPLRVLRTLGVQSADKQKELGLAAPKRTLTVVQRSGRETAFKVSDPMPGITATYVMNVADGSVYLLQPNVVSQLEAALSQLVDRRLHSFKQTDVDALVIKGGDKQRELVQTADPQGAVRLAPKGTPEKADDLTRNWADKVWRIAGTELLGKGETPTAGEPKVEGRLEYLKRGQALGFVDLARGSGGELYLRSEFSAGWVKGTGKADDLLSELKKVLDPS